MLQGSTPGALKTVAIHQSLLLCIANQSEAWADCVHLDQEDTTKIRSANEATPSVSLRFVIGRDRLGWGAFRVVDLRRSCVLYRFLDCVRVYPKQRGAPLLQLLAEFDSD